MERTLLSIVIILFGLSLKAQLLNSEWETVDPSITWTWNWDLTTDQDRLVAVNENGTLNIRTESGWENIEIDPNDSDLEPRGVAIDANGVIWFTTLEHGLWSYSESGNLQNYTSSNSSLPVNNLRSLAINGEDLWISTDGLGLIRFNPSTDDVSYFTESNTAPLKSDFNLDPHIDNSGNVWFKNRECLSSISPNMTWTSEDMRLHIPGSGVRDIHIVSDDEIWLAMDGGVVLYDGNDFNVVIDDRFRIFIQAFKDSRGDIWLSSLSTLSGDGITVIREGESYFFDMDDNDRIPSQVFEFVEHQDTVIAVGTIGNSVAKLVFEEPSLIEDGSIGVLNIYPNPASLEVFLPEEIIGDNAEISIYDISGNRAMPSIPARSQVNISNLTDGQYLMKLQTEKGSFINRLVVQNK